MATGAHRSTLKGARLPSQPSADCQTKFGADIKNPKKADVCELKGVGASRVNDYYGDDVVIRSSSVLSVRVN